MCGWPLGLYPTCVWELILIPISILTTEIFDGISYNLVHMEPKNLVADYNECKV